MGRTKDNKKVVRKRGAGSIVKLRSLLDLDEEEAAAAPAAEKQDGLGTAASSFLSMSLAGSAQSLRTTPRAAEGAKTPMLRKPSFRGGIEEGEEPVWEFSADKDA